MPSIKSRKREIVSILFDYEEVSEEILRLVLGSTNRSRIILDALFKDGIVKKSSMRINPTRGKYLEYFSIQNPERKRKQAQIYAETGRIKESYKAYEELLFCDYQRVSMELYGMYMLALQDNDRERAHRLIDKQKEMARCFEMGKYHEISSKLELATLEKDADSVVAVVGEMLSCVEQIGDFRKAPLYEHMDFKEIREDFMAELRKNLLKSFCDEKSYRFLENDERWQRLIKQ